MELEIYTCDQWKKDFMKASKIKLSGVKSDYAEKIIFRVSPCNEEVIQNTLLSAIEKYKKKD
jgi:AAA+ superfamily predicted ATPase|tara:strand:- start:7277 stop:7462 length:186 start_codon:yes stop_codon:yes gene_type:complete